MSSTDFLKHSWGKHDDTLQSKLPSLTPFPIMKLISLVYLKTNNIIPIPPIPRCTAVSFNAVSTIAKGWSPATFSLPSKERTSITGGTAPVIICRYYTSHFHSPRGPKNSWNGAAGFNPRATVIATPIPNIHPADWEQCPSAREGAGIWILVVPQRHNRRYEILISLWTLRIAHQIAIISSHPEKLVQNHCSAIYNTRWRWWPRLSSSIFPFLPYNRLYASSCDLDVWS